MDEKWLWVGSLAKKGGNHSDTYQSYSKYYGAYFCKVLLAQQNENASDLTVAFKMIEDQFGQDLQIENMESGPYRKHGITL